MPVLKEIQLNSFQFVEFGILVLKKIISKDIEAGLSSCFYLFTAYVCSNFNIKDESY
ncbi:MAG: hypothetical protein JWQ09_2612 [Segetibacter sp.]|nr:hypothetical protein [Segetibacter sp.]